MDINELVKELNKALADERLAYYQYWIGAKVAKGPLRGGVVAELEEHAAEELKHAGKLAERILQLGGTPLLSPEEWCRVTNCGYAVPDDFKTKKLLEQNIKGEQCAIEAYQKLANLVKDVDHITYHLVLGILEDEVKHEEDLEALVEDMKMM